MDKLQELYTSIIDGKKQELQHKKDIRETESEMNRILHLQLVTKLSWLTEYGIVPNLVKEDHLKVSMCEYNGKKDVVLQGWHVELTGWDDLEIHVFPGLPNDLFIYFRRQGVYRYTLEEFISYIANHITVHI